MKTITQHKINYLFIFICVLIAAHVISCKTQKREAREAADIRSILDGTSRGWNTGDLALYLSPYTPDATEMRHTGPTGGVDSIASTMKRGFWKKGRPTQDLRYDSVQVRFLSPRSALVTGKYVLTGGARPQRSGWFTTVWIKNKHGWKMVHDHS
jgi:uncharacterized protein (TIGR02246 family)